MNKGIDMIESFLGRAIESGSINKIKCLECGAETISITVDEDIDLMCGECGSEEIEVEELN